MDKYIKTGYLYAPFKLFYIKDSNVMDFELHYHDFYKVLIFLSGNVTYYIEGKTYSLSPNDIVLVNAGDIHRPIVHDTSFYERIIMYLSPALFEDAELSPLYKCFEHSKKEKSNLIHITAADFTESFKTLFDALMHSCNDESCVKSMHQRIHVLDFLIHLNDYVLSRQNAFKLDYISNSKIISAINYINSHITDPLTVENIANELYITPSYLMHLFKSETGYTLMNYIEKKRLFIANKLLEQGTSKTEACYQSGFKNYSAYYYARKKNEI